MTRLASLPSHLTAGKPTYEPDPAREALVWELRALRSKLSMCAGRLSPTRVSVEREAKRVEAVVVELRRLVERL